MALPTRSTRAALAVLLTACLAPTRVASDGTLEVTSRRDHITLRNLSPRTVYYFAVETSALPVVTWTPCLRLDCAAVPSGAAVALPHEQITRYEDGAREVTVYWWHLVPADSGGYRAESISSLRAPL